MIPARSFRWSAPAPAARGEVDTVEAGSSGAVVTAGAVMGVAAMAPGGHSLSGVERSRSTTDDGSNAAAALAADALVVKAGADVVSPPDVTGAGASPPMPPGDMICDMPTPNSPLGGPDDVLDMDWEASSFVRPMEPMGASAGDGGRLPGAWDINGMVPGAADLTKALVECATATKALVVAGPEADGTALRTADPPPE